MRDRIRSIVAQHGRLTADLSTLDDEADLYDAGMTSHGSVAVMIELEAAFAVEFPEHLIKRSVFQSIARLDTALALLMNNGRSPAPPHLGHVMQASKGAGER